MICLWGASATEWKPTGKTDVQSWKKFNVPTMPADG